MITVKSGRLVLQCDACRKPVTGEAGYVHIRMADVNAVEQAVAEWNRRTEARREEHAEAAEGRRTIRLIPASEFLNYPSSARWHVHHRACDPAPESGDYWFAAGRCDTWPKLVAWTAHLMGKGWLQYTDWDDVLQAAVNAAGVNP